MRTHFLVLSRRNLLAMLRHLDQMPHSHGRDTDTMTVDLVEGQVPPLDDGSKVVTTLRMWGAEDVAPEPVQPANPAVQPCGFCDGKGKWEYDMLGRTDKCPFCLGQGALPKPPAIEAKGEYAANPSEVTGSYAKSIQADIEKCPECFGTGARAVAGFLCPKCRGIGFLSSTTTP